MLFKTALFLLVSINVYAQGELNFDEIEQLKVSSIKGVDKEFAFMKDELKDKDIVLFGEGVHTSVEVNNLYANLIQYLHDSLGFDVLLTERGFYDLTCLSRFKDLKSIKELEDSLNEELPYSAWYIYEKEMLQFWFQNKTNKIPFSYHGIDLVYPLADINRNIFRDFESEFALYNGSILIDQDYVCFKNMVLTPSTPEKMLKNEARLMASIKAIVDKIEFNSVNLNNEQKKYWKNIFNNLSVGLFYNLDYFKTHKKDYEIANGAYWNKRDSMMAQNINFYIDRYKGHKFIIFTSTYHMTSNINKIEGANKVFKNAIPMGEYIRSKYKERTFYATALVGQGTVGTESIQSKSKLFPYIIPKRKSNSLEKHLDLNGEQFQYLSFKQFPDQRFFTIYPYYYEGLNADWKNIFDGVFFIKKVTSKYPSLLSE